MGRDFFNTYSRFIFNSFQFNFEKGELEHTVRLVCKEWNNLVKRVWSITKHLDFSDAQIPAIHIHNLIFPISAQLHSLILMSCDSKYFYYYYNLFSENDVDISQTTLDELIPKCNSLQRLDIPFGIQ